MAAAADEDAMKRLVRRGTVTSVDDDGGRDGNPVNLSSHLFVIATPLDHQPPEASEPKRKAGDAKKAASRCGRCCGGASKSSRLDVIKLKDQERFNKKMANLVRASGLTIEPLPDDGLRKCLFGVGVSPTAAAFEELIRAADTDKDGLSSADVARYVWEKLSNIAAVSPPNQKFFMQATANGHVESIFPLHDANTTAQLRSTWVKSWKGQPIDEIRDYFGETIAFYFAFLGYYTRALVVPAVAGLALTYHHAVAGAVSKWTMVFSCLVVVWAGGLMSMWGRSQSQWALKWRSLGRPPDPKSSPFPFNEKRQEFVRVPMLQRLAPYLVTIPSTIAMLVLSVVSMFVCDLFAETVIQALAVHPVFSPESALQPGVAGPSRAPIVDPDSEWATLGIDDLWEALPLWALWAIYVTPSVTYAIVLAVLDTVYAKMAVRFTKWELGAHIGEKHVLYESSLIVKLALFQFINNFFSLFFLAFYVQDLERLRSRLVTLLVVRQLLQQFQEVLVPMLKGSMRIRSASKLEKAQAERAAAEGGGAAEPSSAANAKRKPAEKQPGRASREAALEPYEDTYDDMLELWIQFGHTTLFASVFPLAALCALVNNVIEIRSDAFKVCEARRPVPTRARSIGPWMAVFEIMGYAAVITNMALMAISSNMMDSYMPGMPVEWRLAALVAIEHGAILAKLLLAWVIPDQPASVALSIANQQLQASLREKAREAGERAAVSARGAVAGVIAANAFAEGAAVSTLGASPAARSTGAETATTDAETRPLRSAESFRQAAAALAGAGARSEGSPGPSASPAPAEGAFPSQAHIVAALEAVVKEIVPALAGDGDEAASLPPYRYFRTAVADRLGRPLPRDKQWREWFRRSVDTAVNSPAFESAS